MNLAKKFSMVKINVDTNKKLNQKYKEGGGYVPRTIVLHPSGKIMKKIYAQGGQYKYYVDSTDPGELISLMKNALKNK